MVPDTSLLALIPLLLKQEREGGLLDLLCSRNARPQKALVGRAQGEAL